MADIPVQCPACGNQFRVSEYVDQEKLLCAKCGAAIPPTSKSVGQPTPLPKLRLATAKPAQPVEQTPSAGTNTSQAWMRRRQQNAKRNSLRHHLSLLRRINGSLWLNWTIFVILAGVGLYLRFVEPLSDGFQAEMRFWGALALLVCHVTIVISALSDDIFQGMLCLLVPGYTLYYIFAMSDEHFLRAITAALAMAFGLDAWQYLSIISMDLFDSINRWMQAGGDMNNAHIYGH